MRLYRKPPNRPWRLLDAVQQVYSDGPWCPDWCSFTYFKPGYRGKLMITLSRTAFNGTGSPPGEVTVTVGTVRINEHQQTPVFKYVYRREHAVIDNGTQKTLVVPVARTPVRVELRIKHTFQASTSDRRPLGAQVAFKFVPTVPAH